MAIRCCWCLLVLADGAGGYSTGAEAARCAIESLQDCVAQRGDLPLRAAILNGFEAAHAAVTAQLQGAGTTFVVVELSGGAARTYHAGDSGVCIIGGRGKIKLQTVLHSPTGYAMESGLLNEREAMKHDECHFVSNLIGLENMSVELGSPLQLAQRDTVVVASDGLFDNLLPNEIAALSRGGRVDDACTRLVGRASKRMANAQDSNLPGKPDDLAVILYRQMS